MITGLAHRGYPKKYPENTLGSFQAALDLQYSHCEIDVQLSKDGVPVVIHDTTVNRTTNGAGKVGELTLEQLQRLDAGNGERIPTLEEVLQLGRGKVSIDIEFKQAGRMYPGLEQAALDVIRRSDMLDQVFITSFDHYSIIRTRELCADIELGWILYGATPLIFEHSKSYGVRYASVNYKYLTPTFAEQCREHGIQLVAWTIDHEEPMRELLETYPEVLICTNELELWKQISSK